MICVKVNSVKATELASVSVVVKHAPSRAGWFAISSLKKINCHDFLKESLPSDFGKPN